MARKHKGPRMSRDERRSQRNKKIMSYVLVLLMVASVAGIYASSQTGSTIDYAYEDYSFYVRPEPSLNNQNVFALEGDKSSMYFYSIPQDSLYIDSQGNLSEVFYPAQTFVLSTNSDIRYASFYDQLRYDIDTYAGKMSVPGLLSKNDSFDIPVITCDNATAEMPVIELRLSNETYIISNPNGCIKIDTKINDLALIRDRLLFTSLGIIDE